METILVLYLAYSAVAGLLGFICTAIFVLVATVTLHQDGYKWKDVFDQNSNFYKPKY